MSDVCKSNIPAVLLWNFIVISASYECLFISYFTEKISTYFFLLMLSILQPGTAIPQKRAPPTHSFEVRLLLDEKLPSLKVGGKHPTAGHLVSHICLPLTFYGDMWIKKSIKLIFLFYHKWREEEPLPIKSGGANLLPNLWKIRQASSHTEPRKAVVILSILSIQQKLWEI